MSNPIIGLTTYGRDPTGAGDYTLPAAYADAIVRAGGIPVQLPPATDMTAMMERLDGLLLSGGGDMAPSMYGAADHGSIYMVDSHRDQGELALARQAANGQLPCLCICRGIQVLNVALGGTLITHLPERVGDAVAHRVPPRRPAFHDVDIDAGSRLQQIIGARRTLVASWHHQAIDALAPGLRAVAHAADGTIEATELDGHPFMLAVQWHPEITAAEDPRQQALFNALVGAVEAS